LAILNSRRSSKTIHCYHTMVGRGIVNYRINACIARLQVEWRPASAGDRLTTTLTRTYHLLRVKPITETETERERERYRDPLSRLEVDNVSREDV